MAATSTTNGDFSALADNTLTLPFECSYPACIRRFATLKEMKQHKLGDPDHYYCKKCDVDCEDWDDLTKHKVEAMAPWIDGPMKGNREVPPKHIVCEFCGMDFKTIGARRFHRDHCHPSDQSITCPFQDCSLIFVKGSAYIRHFEDGRCPGMSAYQFRKELEQVHVNSQIMKDTTIVERLQESLYAARLGYSASLDGTDTDTEYGGVALSETPSIIDGNGEELIGVKPLEPDEDLISLHEPRPPTATGNPTSWYTRSTPILQSMRRMSITSNAPSIDGTELSASEYASRISKVKLPSAKRHNGSTYTESWPSLTSPSYAASVLSGALSESTGVVSNSTPPLALGTETTARAVFPHAKPTPASHPRGQSQLGSGLDLRRVRWWDPDHEDFEPDCFRSKELMETKSFGCPFADCENDYICDTVGDLKQHLRLAHLDIDWRCPCCKKKFVRPSALLAHAESNGRCQVESSSHFKALIADITAGFLKATRLTPPKIFVQDKALVLADGTPANGIMQTEYKANVPRQR